MVKEVIRIDPDYEKIIRLCRKEMEIKFVNYGNTWLELDDLYFKERLTKEFKEYLESMTIESEQRKLLNIINIACMAHQTARTNRGCRKHKPTFEDIMNSKGTQIASVCTVCGKDVFIENGIIYVQGEENG